MPIIAVSVIMPVFNKEILLKRSLDSLEHQTFKNFEIILVDDCSNDSSSTYIIERMKNTFNIRFIQHFFNQGTNMARIHAVMNSKGQYIMSLDPDDQYTNDAIEKSYINAFKYNADILEYDFFVIKKDLKNITYRTCRGTFKNKKLLLDKLQDFNYYKTNWNTCKKIIRRNLYLQAVKFILPFVKNKKISYSEDLLHSSVIFILMKKFVCGHFTPYIYYYGIEGSSTTKAYDNKRQRVYQISLVRHLSHYFYINRNDLSKCSLRDFLKNKTYLQLYKRVININKTKTKSCDFIEGFNVKYDNFDYCLYERIN